MLCKAPKFSLLSKRIMVARGKESICNAGDTAEVGLIRGSGRSPGEGNGNPLQYSCLWKILWTEESSRLLSIGLQRVKNDWATEQQRKTSVNEDRVSLLSSHHYFIHLDSLLTSPLLLAATPKAWFLPLAHIRLYRVGPKNIASRLFKKQTNKARGTKV